MAQRQPVLGEQGLGRGAAQAGLQGRGHRVGVDREQPVEAHQVERDDAGKALAPCHQATDHRGAATERDQGHVVLHRPVDQGRDLVVGGWPDHRVGRVRPVAGAQLEQVGGGLAAGAVQPGLVVGEHVLGTDDPGERLEQVGCERLREPHLGGVDRGGVRRADEGVDERERALGQGACLGRVAPA